MFELKNATHTSLRRKEIAFITLLVLFTGYVNAQSLKDDGVFAGAESVRIEASVDKSRFPINGNFVVRCEVNNVGGSTLLVSDTEIAGGTLKVIVRDEDGVELQTNIATDEWLSHPLTWQEKVKWYWFPLFSGHFVGRRIEVNLAAYSKSRPGTRYKISARLVSTPDPEISQQDLKSIFPFKARILRGEIESAPVWITVDPPCCKAPSK